LTGLFVSPRGLRRREGTGGGRLERDSSTIREAHRRGAVVALPISLNRETLDAIQAGRANPPFGRSVAPHPMTETSAKKRKWL
jgi:hypothetical protein